MFLARDPDKHSVAIKVFRLDITPEQAAGLSAQLVNVARANLSHPSIAAPIAAGVEGTVAYLAQEYVVAESLDAAIRQYGPAPTDQAMRILASIAGGLDFAAAAGVNHGALHLRDLLVTPSEARVTGLGVARALESIGLRAPVRRPYTAPERSQREAWDGRADIYSFGMIARELLVGGRRAETEQKLPAAVATRLESIFARASAARPDQRFSNALELIAALQDVVAGAGAAATKHKAAPAADLLLPLEPAVAAEATADAASDLRELEVAAPAPEPSIPDFSFDRAAHAEEPRPEFSEPIDLDDLDVGMKANEAEAAGIEGDRFMDAFGAEPSESELERTDFAGTPAAIGTVEREPFALAAEEPRLRAAEPESVPAVRRVEPARLSIVPYAVVLLVGILLGGVAGYLLGSSATTSLAPASQRAQPARTPAGVPPAASSGAPASPTAGTTGIASAPAAATTAARVTLPASRVVDGRLTVRSSPRASVSVNGRARGLTPLRLRSLAPGRYTVRVTRRGYVTEDREVTLTADRPTSTLTFSLDRAGAQKPAAPARADEQRAPARASFAGSLFVDSLPAGSQVFVDGQLRGTTPCVISSVPVGSHVVRVERVGFKRWAQPVQVASGQRVRVTASLERESQ